MMAPLFAPLVTLADLIHTFLASFIDEITG